MVDVTPADAVPPAEVAEMELYHPHSWWTKYVFSQDAKVIAIQYSATATAIGFVALMTMMVFESDYTLLTRITFFGAGP